MNNIVLTTQKIKPKLSHAKIRDNLESFFFAGSGDRYLAEWAKHSGTVIKTYHFSKQNVPWGGKPPKANHSISNERNCGYKLKIVQPFRNHITNNRYGLVVDEFTTDVPYISPDPDRHTASVCPIKHLAHCKIVIKLALAYKDYFSLGETNENNGSAKLFMYAKDRKPIPIKIATEIAEKFKLDFFNLTGEQIECFPAKGNGNVKLPCNPNKCTIIDSGEVEPYEEAFELVAIGDKKQRQYYDTHNLREYQAALDRGNNLDVDCWLKSIEQGCINLPYKALETDDSQVSTKPCEVRSAAKPPNRLPKMPTAKKIIVSKTSLDELRLEPDAFIRQSEAMRILCRKLKRVATVEEGLDFIKQNNLYSGDWFNPARSSRVKDILRFTAKTFDKTKCGNGGSFDFNPKKHIKFIKSKFQGSYKISKTGFDINKSSSGFVRQRKSIITLKEINIYHTIFESCRSSAKYKDGGVPELRMSQMWDVLKSTGQIKGSWNRDKWEWLRGRLIDLKVIVCDFVKQRKKSYCYSEGENHPIHRHDWKAKAVLPKMPATSLITKRKKHNTVSGLAILFLKDEGVKRQLEHPPPLILN